MESSRLESPGIRPLKIAGLNTTAADGLCAPAAVVKADHRSIEPTRRRRAHSKFELFFHRREPPSLEMGGVYHVFLSLRGRSPRGAAGQMKVEAPSRGFVRSNPYVDRDCFIVTPLSFSHYRLTKGVMPGSRRLSRLICHEMLNISKITHGTGAAFGTV